MLDYENFLKKQEELDIEMALIWDKPYLDGVTFYDKYIKIRERSRILWILKEPNGTGGGNQREYHKDVRGYDKWMSTFGNIMRVAFGILDGSEDYSDIPEIDNKEATIDDVPVLDEIAIININKSGGNSTTPPGKLDIEYKRNGVKDFLFKQIELIEPGIIINSHGVYQFFKDQVGDNKITTINGEQYAINNDRLIIWTSHPNRAPKESYCNNILRIINKN